MSTHDDGGPAWPHTALVDSDEHGIRQHEERHPGMSLLDWFAGQALAGCIAHHASDSHDENEIARQSWTLAAAMLAEKRRRESAATGAGGEGQ